MHLVPVILCNGIESRLWPISSELPSKPFVRSADGYSLLQKNILRGAQLARVQKIITITNRDIFYKIKEQFNELNLAPQTMSFILEPFQRDTAAAITTAALHTAQLYNKDALMLVLGVEHLNIDEEAFKRTIAVARKAARLGKLVTFGMNRYSTNSKYGRSNNNVLPFVKKSTSKVIKKPLANEQFLWNSSLFLFRAGALLQAMKEHCPDVLTATLTCLEHSQFIEEHNALELDPVSFFSIPKRSVNEEVIKKSYKTTVIPCDLNWIDNKS